MLRHLRQLFTEIIIVLRLLPGLFVELPAIFRSLRIILQAIVWGFIVKPRGLGETVQIQKKEIHGMLFFKLRTQLNPIPPETITAEGIVSQRMTVLDANGVPLVIGGVSQTPVEVSATATEIEYWVGPKDATVRRQFDYVDADGNDSGNFEDDYVVVDQIGPTGPVGLGATVQIEQRDDGT